MSSESGRSVVPGGLRELASSNSVEVGRVRTAESPEKTRLSGRSHSPKCDIHYWERYELRDEDGTLYFVGYQCRWCGEPGYDLDLEASSR
jgi:hypothetical protein